MCGVEPEKMVGKHKVVGVSHDQKFKGVVGSLQSEPVGGLIQE